MNEILNRLLEGGVLERIVDGLSVDDPSSILDAREEATFESKWLTVYELLKSREVSSDDTKAINSIREVIFKSVFRKTADDDLAAYASDDFELVGRALASRIEEPFVTTLWREYVSGRFPTIASDHPESDLVTVVNDYLH